MTKEQIREELSAKKAKQVKLINKLDKLVSNGEGLDEEGLRKEAKLRGKIAELNVEIDTLEEKLERKEKGLTFGQKLAITLATIGLCGFIGIVIGKNSCQKKTTTVVPTTPDKSISAMAASVSGSKDVVVNAMPATAAPTAMPTPVPTAVPTATPTAVPTPVPTPEPTAVPDVVVDVTNDENVSEAAANIYESYIMPILEKNPALADFFTIEAVEDIIKMANGELPVNSKYNEFTIGGNANIMNDMFANQGNHNVLYPFDFSRLYPVGSAEARYIQTYDDIYRQIAIYRAEGNGDGVVEQIGKLGEKLYNEWHIAGMYGGYNPYLFPAQERYFLLQAATSRFSNYVREYLESNDLTVCIPTCYDVEPGEYRSVEIRDIFEALYAENATSKNGAISIVDETGKPIKVFAEAFADAKAYFDARAYAKVKSLG